MRAMRPTEAWNERLVSFAFWAMNGGLLGMVLLSVLPVGLLQTWASVEHGYAYARSAEFLQTPLIHLLRWLRVPGDTVFAAGAVAIVAFLFGVGRGRRAPAPLATSGSEDVGAVAAAE